MRRAVFSILLLTSSCQRDAPKPAPPRVTPVRTEPAAVLTYTTLDAGVGREVAAKGMLVEVRFVVTAPDGGVVESTGTRAEPFRFVVERPGPPPVIDELVHGMSPGATRRAKTVDGFTFLNRPAGDTIELELFGIEYLISR